MYPPHHYGGYELSCLDVVERLRQRGHDVTVLTVIAGLGGRAITKRSIVRAAGQATRGELEEVHFLDLDWNVVKRELARMADKRRSGPSAENILREVGPVRRVV
jgi:pyruvate ferredoxin oxidoreductase alpha subunit